MIDDPVLINDWYIVAAARDLNDVTPLAVRLWDEELVVWRSGDDVIAWRDYCVHRGAKLSPGEVKEGTLVCPYHGWRYGPSGACTLIPAHPEIQPPAKARAVAYKAVESDGYIWVSLVKKSIRNLINLCDCFLNKHFIQIEFRNGF